MPLAFEADDWQPTTGSAEGEIDIEIISLPGNGGATITDIKYQLDGGSWESSGGTTDFTITAPAADTSYAIKLRAVNSEGDGAIGNEESATSGAAATGTQPVIEFTMASGATTTSWTDTKNSRVLPLGTNGGNAPTIEAIRPDGGNAYSFDSGESFYADASTWTELPDGAEERTMVIVMRCPSGGSGYPGAMYGNGATADAFGLQLRSDGTYMVTLWAVDTRSGSTQFYGTDWATLTGVYTAAGDLILYYNGGFIKTVARVAHTVLDSFGMNADANGGDAGVCDIAYCAVYDVAMDATEVADLNTALVAEFLTP